MLLNSFKNMTFSHYKIMLFYRWALIYVPITEWLCVVGPSFLIEEVISSLLLSPRR